MRVKIVFLIVFILLICLSSIRAQINYTLRSSRIFKAVPYVNAPPDLSDQEVKLVGYPADSDVMNIWKKLTASLSTTPKSDLVNRIELISSPIKSIISYQFKEPGGVTNRIFYDKTFFTQFDGIKGIDVDYLILFSLAHEIGHIVNGDVSSAIHSVGVELKADEFACSTLCGLQLASEDRINKVLLTLAGATDGLAGHPGKGDRIKHTSKFFNSGRCMSTKAMEFEDFSTQENKWKFWTGIAGSSYSAKINTLSKSYVLQLTTNPGWNWTWIPFSGEMDKLFNNYSGAQLSFNFTSDNVSRQNSSALFGFMSEPECVSNSCPGGSHYDLWFIKNRTSSDTYHLTARFFYNDNCNCHPEKEINAVEKNVTTSKNSNIRIMKYENSYTVYCDDQILISFNISGSIVSKLIYGVGTHYISDFRAQEL